MADMEIDGIGSDTWKMESPETSEQGDFSILLSKDFEKLQGLIDAHMKRAAAAPAPIPLFNDVHHKASLRDLIEKHKRTMPQIATGTCLQLFSEAEKKMGKIDRMSQRTPQERSAMKETVFRQYQDRIGKIVFLGDRYPNETEKLLGKKNPRPLEVIDNRFDQEIAALMAKVQRGFDLQKASGVQDPDLSRSIQLPCEIAQMLLSSTGQINFALIHPLNTALFLNRTLLQYETIIQRVFQKIDSSWQPLFDTIKKPADGSNISNDLIRADLGLSPSDPIQDIHAKQVVLAALLTQHCQGPVGDCFAVAFSIQLHNEFFKSALEQYGELVQNGSLKKLVNGTPDRFFFKTTIADEDLQKPIACDKVGRLNGGSLYLWEAPSFAAAFRQMGIDNAQILFPQAFKIFSQGTITPDAIIAAYAEAANKQVDKGRYGFSSINNRMLRAFETALAGMAEARRGCYVRDSVIQCVQTALDETWNKSKKGAAPQTLPLIGNMQKTFETILNARIRFVYNGAIPYAGVSSDGSSTAGGFELYKRDANEFLMGTRVGTPQEFQTLVLEIVDLTAKAQTPLTDEEKKTVAAAAQAIAQYVQGKAFLRNAFVAYEPANGNDPDPVANYAQLERTPMTSKDGDNPWEVITIDTGLTFQPNIQSAHPKNPYDLLKWVLDLASWKEKTQRYLEDALPNEIDPVTSPQHAFNLSIEDAEIVAFLQSGLSSAQWIQKKVIEPGQSVANWLADSATKQAIAGIIVEELKQSSAAAASIFQKWVQPIISQMQTLSQFASTILNGILGILKVPADQTKQVALLIDQIVLQSLPASQLQQLEQNAMRIAMTNWNDRNKDIYFCIFYDPRSNLPAFGIIDEDRTNLSPMDDSEWVDNQQWDADVSDVDDLIKTKK